MERKFNRNALNVQLVIPASNKEDVHSIPSMLFILILNA